MKMSPSSLQCAWQNPFSSHQSRKDCYILSKIMGTHSYRPTWISPKDVYQGVLMAVCRTLLGSHSVGCDSLIWIKDLIIIVLFFLLNRLDQSGNTLLINVHVGAISHCCYSTQTPTPVRSTLIRLQRKKLWPLVLEPLPKVCTFGKPLFFFFLRLWSTLWQ